MGAEEETRGWQMDQTEIPSSGRDDRLTAHWLNSVADESVWYVEEGKSSTHAI